MLKGLSLEIHIGKVDTKVEFSYNNSRIGSGTLNLS